MVNFYKEPAKTREGPKPVIPAKAGTQFFQMFAEDLSFAFLNPENSAGPVSFMFRGGERRGIHESIHGQETARG